MKTQTPSERITNAHNEGQKDGSKHESKYETYQPPNNMGTPADLLRSNSELNIRQEENKAYDGGFNHGRSQR